MEQWLNSLLCLDASVVPRVSSGWPQCFFGFTSSLIRWFSSYFSHFKKKKTYKGCPAPAACELYCVDRDALFSFNRVSELFLQRLMALYVASHYKVEECWLCAVRTHISLFFFAVQNTPNDLQLLSDAPAHRIFCLLGPIKPGEMLPEILCVIQVALEGEISKASVMKSLSRGVRASGDLIPWTVSQQVFYIKKKKRKKKKTKKKKKKKKKT